MMRTDGDNRLSSPNFFVGKSIVGVERELDKLTVSPFVMETEEIDSESKYHFASPCRRDADLRFRHGRVRFLPLEDFFGHSDAERGFWSRIWSNSEPELDGAPTKTKRNVFFVVMSQNETKRKRRAGSFLLLSSVGDGRSS